jgi:hypothetical protein
MAWFAVRSFQNKAQKQTPNSESFASRQSNAQRATPKGFASRQLNAEVAEVRLKAGVVFDCATNSIAAWTDCGTACDSFTVRRPLRPGFDIAFCDIKTSNSLARQLEHEVRRETVATKKGCGETNAQRPTPNAQRSTAKLQRSDGKPRFTFGSARL